MKRILSVRLHGIPVGTLEKNDGTLEFKYLPKAKSPLSLSLPLQEEVFRGGNAYFGGLLTENENTRKLIGRRFRIHFIISYKTRGFSPAPWQSKAFVFLIIPFFNSFEI
jgi:HipA-like protein